MLQVLLDLVFQAPLAKTVTEDADGRKRTSYVPADLPAGVDPSVIPGCQNVLKFWEPNVCYRKNDLVRKGSVDYLALEDSQDDPTIGESWVIARINQKGAGGDDGQDEIL